jgi:hypothetical protein
MGERERGREREREANNQSCSIKLEETGDLLFKKCTVYVKKGMLPNDQRVLKRQSLYSFVGKCMGKHSGPCIVSCMPYNFLLNF